MIRLIIIFLSFTVLTALDAQNIWTSVEESQIPSSFLTDREIVPISYSSWELQLEGIKKALKKAPDEFSNGRSNKEITLDIPMPDGTLMPFKIYETSSMMKGLSFKYPQIKSFAGYGLANKQYKIRLGHNIHGFYASILSPEGTIYIDRISNQQTKYYISYYTRDQYIQAEGHSFSCGVQDQGTDPLEDVLRDFEFNGEIEDHLKRTENRDPSEPIQLRTYRLAIGCTGEWGIKQGGTIEGALAQMVISVDRINQVFENEIAVRFLLVEDNDLVIFLNASTDPYNEGNVGGSLLGQNTSILNQFIGFSNYDMGHVYTASCTDVGGIAFLECVCKGNKGGGVTCHYTNNIIAMSVRVTCHEMGHQFGANHTFNNCNGNESGSNAFEPGSGSTIMSYGGLCGPELNIVNFADDYYHNNSLDEMIKYSRQFEGNNCATKIATSNNTPEAGIQMESGFYIPVETPFELTGEAFDPEGDEMTYNWEQMNLGPSSVPGQPNVNSPLFRSVYPGTSTTRVFPEMTKIINMNFDKTEVLPTYDRDLDFRFIARDNNTEGGGVDWAEISFEATATAGPFLVEYPNGSESFEVGESVIINWDVANTSNSLVDCKRVDIFLSLDGGYTYPYLLFSEAPNDGIQEITIPNTPTNQARIKIKGVGNVFFDISNGNFQILEPSVPGYYFDYSPTNQLVCLPDEAEVDFETVGFLNFESPIFFEIIDGLPENALYGFSQNNIAPGENTILTLILDGSVEPGVYEILIRASAANADTIYRTAEFSLVSTDFSELVAISPESGTEGLEQSLNFSWNGDDDVDYYIFEISDNPSFSGEFVFTKETAETDYDLEVLLDKSTVYYWRISGNNICGLSEPGEIQTFSTIALGCKTFNYLDVPKNITQNGTPTILAELNIFDSGSITDLNIEKIRGSHEWVGDLDVSLIGPDGTEVRLWESECFNQSNFNCGFDDSSPYEIACPLTQGLFFKPLDALSVFNGYDIAGKWTLKIKDNVSGSGGSLQEYKLELCSNVVLEKPYLVNNELFPLPPGVGRRINPTFLLSEDNDNDADELLYTIVHYPKHGSVYFENTILNVGSQFSQEDIDNNHIRYVHDGSATAIDSFSFTVVDDAGGWIDITYFHIELDESIVLSAEDENLNAIQIFPNPTNDQIQIQFDESIGGQILYSIYNLEGKLMYRQTIPGQSTHTISMDSFDAGMYILQIHSEKEFINKKIIKQ